MTAVCTLHMQNKINAAKTCGASARYYARQEAFEKCWAHSPLRAVLYCHSPGVATVASMSTTTRDRGDRYGPIEWAQKLAGDVMSDVTDIV